MALSIVPPIQRRVLEFMAEAGCSDDEIVSVKALMEKEWGPQPPDDRSILELAFELTSGERQQDYGDPTENHERIAALWSVILDMEVTAVQVVACMVAVKLARLVETPGHVDSWVDVAGYAQVAGWILGRRRS